MRAWILDVRIRDPERHLASLSEHLLTRGIEVGENLDRNVRVTNQGRN